MGRINFFRFVIFHAFDRQSDGQTDRRSWQDRGCIGSVYSRHLQGDIPQSLIYPRPPKKNLRIRQNQLLVQRKALLLGVSARPSEQGLCPWTPLGNSPDSQQWRQSNGVHDVRTLPVFSHVVSKYYVQMCKNLQLLGPGGSPRSFAPGPHWGLPKFQSPSQWRRQL